MIITFAHTKGGVGKSTLAWHFIYLLKLLGFKVKLIDLDFQQTLYFVNQIRAAAKLDTVEVLQCSSSAELINIFESTKEDEILIVDVGGFDNDINRTAISWADKIIVPISSSVTEVLGFKTFEKILEEIDNPFINIVLNNIHHKTKNFDVITEAIGDNPNFKLLDTVIRRNNGFATPMGYGKTIFDTENIQLQEQIKELYHELKLH